MDLLPWSLSSLRRQHRKLLAVLGVDVPLHSRAQQDGSAHVERWGSRYAYVRTERGTEYERRQTRSVEEVLYWLMKDLTLRLASDQELQHRRSDEDTRRQLFARQVELLARLNADWAVRARREHDEILRSHPFVDGR